MALYKSSPISGGSMTETVLWTNPNESVNFADSTVSLSQSMQNFSYIKIVWKKSTSNSNQGILIVPTDVLVKSTEVNQNNFVTIGDGVSSIRTVTYVSDTSVHISGARQVNAAGIANSKAIPLTISGMNF